MFASYTEGNIEDGGTNWRTVGHSRYDAEISGTYFKNLVVFALRSRFHFALWET